MFRIVHFTNNNIIRRIIVKKLLFIISVFFLIHQAINLYAQGTPYNWFRISYRENGISVPMIKFVNIPDTVPLCRYYVNGEDCADSDHKTKLRTPEYPEGRCFAHWEIDISQFNFPKTFIRIDPDPLKPPQSFVLTNAKIQDFWTHYYSAPQKVPPWPGGAGATFAYNCWGWAFGYDCWIEDPDYIYADNYKLVDPYPVGPAVIPYPLMHRVGTVNGNNQWIDTHVVKIDAILSPPGPYDPYLNQYSFYIPVSRSEKMRDSGIYTLSVNMGPPWSSHPPLYQPK